MSQRTIAPKTHLLVCAILVLLTFLTVGVSFTHVAGPWHIAIGLAIAVCKASLVVLFFMHALISPRLTWLVIIIACFWLVAVLFALTLDDYFTRGLVPFTPGH
jgi:cytochrome c oxidase subunit IV